MVLHHTEPFILQRQAKKVCYCYLIFQSQFKSQYLKKSSYNADAIDFLHRVIVDHLLF